MALDTLMIITFCGYVLQSFAVHGILFEVHNVLKCFMIPKNFRLEQPSNSFIAFPGSLRLIITFRSSYGQLGSFYIPDFFSVPGFFLNH